ncbi:hypothetical protein TH53_03295 [Pedobacter lusitanus]|uniref:Uncharacterized protein n=1 Tax=Pedobacter lusitanus TaxID=1503925 RepID=A0A0D0GVK8_9SPHI|nr:hypothetical protein TH53_03295 [Pedobacter lusitanus]
MSEQGGYNYLIISGLKKRYSSGFLEHFFAGFSCKKRGIISLQEPVMYEEKCFFLSFMGNDSRIY